MSIVSKNGQWCEVYIWLGKDTEGKTTTASSGGKQLTPWNEARCGHASMTIFDGKKTVYVSLWPTKFGAEFVQSLEKDQDTQHEGSRPDAIIRLHHLNIPRMLESFSEIRKRAQEGKIFWVAEISNDQDITNPKNSNANCASCVYALLKVGGLTSPSSPYSQHLSGKGPKDRNFYSIVRCDAGMRAGGKFDGAPWTNSWFTPKGLLLRISSAAEAYFDDVTTTMQIMSSDRVVTRK